MSTFISQYITAFVIFIIVDLSWLGFIARDLYKRELSAYMADTPNWPAAFIFYLIYVLGLMIFVIRPGTHSQDNWFHIAQNGALFSFFAYATYDLTNLAVAKHWSITITLIDLIWGAVLGALVCGLTSYISSL